MKTEVDLVYFEKNRQKRTSTSKYTVIDRGEQTTLEQTLVIEKADFDSFKASMQFDKIPSFENEKDAALKLADWMRRMSEAIENHWQDKKQYPEAFPLAKQWNALPPQNQ
ncbi:hypothetical protein [Xenorhabdus hominickii]|uniref:Uncharacterized protein n=1 Tax=Xenorhabdus hominickii TaxID=351679 RepID=A0A2G0Q1G6_XENHO|nr:hypothetical protein [Xenorhabdus hominickii]AOM40412.1 hypothetical protein A9255_07360 [Xenorhabdus hominickii]PHM53069.1 hypothetical protein Xhom_03953 [Xenorhabdus hominickii]